MKRIAILSLTLILLLGNSSCKKFLNVDPPSDLSGNNFWRNKEDIEAFTNGMYELLRKSVTRPDLTANAGTGNFPFFIFGGDFRGAPVQYGSTVWGRTYIIDMANNNLRSLFSTQNSWFGVWNMPRFTQWDLFFRVIASANIAYDRIDDVDDPTLTDVQRKAYKAEAVFLRNMVYFLMVRQWGDVPYYTDPYNNKPLKRMPMVEVLQKCEADLKAAKDDLPWTYNDPVFVAVRGMRGSAIALLMHINMWLAGFDEPNKMAYYKNVDLLGEELRTQNNGAYTLLPLESTGTIFKGRSKEGLFEIPQNQNYNESFGWSTFRDHVGYNDNLPTTYPYISYKSDFMERVYPIGAPDKRTTLWYRAGTIHTGDVRFRMNKFYISTDPNSIDALFSDASQTVFRYPDAILLQAEALAELGEDARAREVVNLVRARSEAPPLTLSGNELKEEIFFERCRELIGEGHYWYDVVRTKRIINAEYKFGYHCTVDQFKSGCWTWPIDPAALINNPQMTLNNFWL